MGNSPAPVVAPPRAGTLGMAWLLPALLLLLALSLRFYRIGAPSLWMDEGYSLQDTGELSEHGAYRPLYFLVLRLWAPLGSGEAWLRAPSALASAGSVLLLFCLARRLAGTRTAALAAVIMALSAQELDHAQEVRMYALGALLSLVAVAFLLRWHERRRLPSLAGHLAASVLAMATTPAALFLVVPAVAYAAWHERRDRRDAAWLGGAWLALLGALLPLAPAAAGALARILTSPHPSSWLPVRDLVSLPAQLLLSPVGFLARAPGIKALFGALAVCCLALLALAALPGGRAPASRTGTLLVAWFALPCVVMFVLASTVIPLWTTRYFLALAPVFYLALALGIDRARRLALGLGVALATFVLAVMIVRLAFNLVEPQREDWRGAVAYLNEIGRPGDVVLTGGPGAAEIWAFYDRSGLPTRDLWAAAEVPNEWPGAAAETASPRHRGRLLVVLRTTQHPEQVLALPNVLAPGCRLLGSFQSGWVTALVVAPAVPY